jgi:hypothetical protein
MSWNGPESLGGRPYGGPLSAVSWAPGRLDIFSVDADDGTLQHWWFDPHSGWGNNQRPESLGGNLDGPALSAVSWAPGRLDIFGVDTNDRTLQHWWFDPQSGWGNNQRPESLGGRLIGAALSAVSWAPGRLDIFGVDGNDVSLQHWWFNPQSGWGNNQRPESLGGRLSVDSLSAVSWAPGRLDIFGMDAIDYALQHWWFDNGWGNNKKPENGFGSNLSPPGLSTVCWQAGRLDIFGVGTDNTLQHWWFENGWGNNKKPESLGGRVAPGALSAVAWAPGRLDIFGVDTNDHTLQHWWYF